MLVSSIFGKGSSLVLKLSPQGFNPSILQHSKLGGTADEAMLMLYNKKHKIHIGCEYIHF
jgi:hypothetical protein